MTLISDLFWAYLVAITLLTITPGVDTLLVMRNTGRGGLRDANRDDAANRPPEAVHGVGLDHSPSRPAQVWHRMGHSRAIDADSTLQARLTLR